MNAKMPQREPSADMRQAARAMREVYNALVAEGFTSDEALKIIGHMLALGQQGGAG